MHETTTIPNPITDTQRATYEALLLALGCDAETVDEDVDGAIWSLQHHGNDNRDGMDILIRGTAMHLRDAADRRRNPRPTISAARHTCESD